MSIKFKPFRYWVQAVLPSAYDDSLSYYELLNKVVNYLNDIASQTETNFNALEENVESLSSNFTALQNYVQNYFYNLDVQEEINNKLDEMAEDGTLDELIQPLFDAYKVQIDETVGSQNARLQVLKARMDTFSQLPTGSTSGDAELQDIRVAYDGKTYPTGGDAVREQVKDLHADIGALIDKEEIVIHDMASGSSQKEILNTGSVGQTGNMRIYPNFSLPPNKKVSVQAITNTSDSNFSLYLLTKNSSNSYVITDKYYMLRETGSTNTTLTHNYETKTIVGRDSILEFDIDASEQERYIGIYSSGNGVYHASSDLQIDEYVSTTVTFDTDIGSTMTTSTSTQRDAVCVGLHYQEVTPKYQNVTLYSDGNQITNTEGQVMDLLSILKIAEIEGATIELYHQDNQDVRLFKLSTINEDYVEFISTYFDDYDVVESRIVVTDEDVDYYETVLGGGTGPSNKMEREVLRLIKNGNTFKITSLEGEELTFDNVFGLTRDLTKYVVVIYGSSKLRPQYVSTNEMLFIGVDRSTESKILRLMMTPNSIFYQDYRLAEYTDITNKIESVVLYTNGNVISRNSDYSDALTYQEFKTITENPLNKVTLIYNIYVLSRVKNSNIIEFSCSSIENNVLHTISVRYDSSNTLQLNETRIANDAREIEIESVCGYFGSNGMKYYVPLNYIEKGKTPLIAVPSNKQIKLNINGTLITVTYTSVEYSNNTLTFIMPSNSYGNHTANGYLSAKLVLQL